MPGPDGAGAWGLAGGVALNGGRQVEPQKRPPDRVDSCAAGLSFLSHHQVSRGPQTTRQMGKSIGRNTMVGSVGPGGVDIEAMCTTS